MYVVAGVSGNTGKVAAEVLLSQKKAVRVIVREDIIMACLLVFHVGEL